MASSAAMRFRPAPPMLAKSPPAYTVVPLTANARTVAFEFGFQAVAIPLDAFSAAMRLRAAPPALVNDPPAYTVVPLTASASTSLSAFGSQLVTTPVVAFSAAMWFRVVPPRMVNAPPTYAFVPLTATAYTGPFAFGFHPLARPLLASTDPVGSASREHRVIADGPLVTIVGGKYTTFRVMARDTLACVVRRLGKDNLALRDPMAPLPAPVAGASIESLAEWAVDAFARRIEDVVRRRSALWLEPDRGRLAAPRVGAVLARRLGWSPSRLREELDSFHGALEREERFLRAAREDP